jgi:phospholipase/carboxylesterase
MEFVLNNIKWISKNTIDKLKSPFHTVGKLEGEAKNVIIALHGFGDNAANFSQLASEFQLSNVLWLFIQGPQSVPVGIDGAQWFPLFSDPKDEIGYSENKLYELIEKVTEVTKLTSEKIFLLGFSQGAAMSLYYTLKSHQKLAGVVSLSGFLTNQSQIIPILQRNNSIPPVFLAHGMLDQVLFPITFFETKNMLQMNNNLKLTSKTYKIAHNISTEEMSDVKKFIEGNRN